MRTASVAIIANVLRNASAARTASVATTASAARSASVVITANARRITSAARNAPAATTASAPRTASVKLPVLSSFCSKSPPLPSFLSLHSLKITMSGSTTTRTLITDRVDRKETHGRAKTVEKGSSGWVLRGFLVTPSNNQAHPIDLPDGSTDLKTWKCVIPGKKGVWILSFIDSLDNMGGRQVPMHAVLPRQLPCAATKMCLHHSHLTRRRF